MTSRAMRKWLAVAVLVALPATPAFGQAIRQSNGTLVGSGTSVLSDDTTAVGMADSTGVFFFEDRELVGIAIRMQTHPADTCRLAIQIRYHVGAGTDSSSIVPILPKSVFVTTTAGPDDSLGFIKIVNPTALARGEDEIVVALVNDAGRAAAWGTYMQGVFMLDEWYAGPLVGPLSVRYRLLHLTTNVAGVSVAPTFKMYFITRKIS